MDKYKDWNEIPIGIRFLVFFRREQIAFETQGKSLFMIKFKRIPFRETRIYYASEKIWEFRWSLDDT